MFAEPTNFEDISKYFKGCFIEVNKEIFSVEKVTPEAIFCSNKNEANFIIEIDGKETKTVGYNLNFLLPQKTWFQYDKFAYFISRIPARMWKKGISKENTSIVALDELGKCRGQTLSFDLIKLYMENKQYYSYRELNNCYSIALNTRFALSKNGYVFLDNNCVAKYQASDNTVVVPYIYQPEITQLFEGCKILCL